MVIGMTGTGKSAFINAMLGRNSARTSAFADSTKVRARAPGGEGGGGRGSCACACGVGPGAWGPRAGAWWSLGRRCTCPAAEQAALPWTDSRHPVSCLPTRTAPALPHPAPHALCSARPHPCAERARGQRPHPRRGPAVHRHARPARLGLQLPAGGARAGGAARQGRCQGASCSQRPAAGWTGGAAALLHASCPALPTLTSHLPQLLPAQNSTTLKAIKAAYKWHKPNFVIYVDRLDAQRAGLGDMGLLQQINEALGLQAFAQMFIVMTHANTARM
jgi:hypothetical protein